MAPAPARPAPCPLSFEPALAGSRGANVSFRKNSKHTRNENYKPKASWARSIGEIKGR